MLPQNKEAVSKGIHDFNVMILDPRTPKLVKPIMGINGKGFNIGEDLYHQLHTLVEVKNPSDNGKEQWLDILKQLQNYHVTSTRNTNAFSIAGDGTRIAFFIYVHDIHSNFANKGKDYNGFLCLAADEHGVKMVEQNDVFGPQIVWYDLSGGNFWMI